MKIKWKKLRKVEQIVASCQFNYTYDTTQCYNTHNSTTLFISWATLTKKFKCLIIALVIKRGKHFNSTNPTFFLLLQLSGNLVAAEATNNETTGTLLHYWHLDLFAHHHHPMGSVFWLDPRISGWTGYHNLCGSLASRNQRRSLFSTR